MGTYISLINYTQKGIENIKDSPERLNAAKEAFKAFGAEMERIPWSLRKRDLNLWP